MFPKDHFGCSVENNCRDVNMGDGGGSLVVFAKIQMLDDWYLNQVSSRGGGEKL